MACDLFRGCDWGVVVGHCDDVNSRAAAVAVRMQCEADSIAGSVECL